MNLSIENYVSARLDIADAGGDLCEYVVHDRADVSDQELLSLFDAQLMARQLDLYARILQQQGEGFYTIGSLGHESNAAVAAALRPSDPALLHYRSGGFYCARASQVLGYDAIRDMLLSFMVSVDDPISGGRHKVFGSKELAIIPQTSTISSHLPRAVGLAFAHERAHTRSKADEWPKDAIVVTSLGDASLNHSTAMGALNAAQHTAHQGVPLPLLVVIEDNGIGISVRSPSGWVESSVERLTGFAQFTAAGTDPAGTLHTARLAVAHVRSTRSPAVLHLRTVRFMGHAGSDAEIAYRSQSEIVGDFASDPLLATASLLLSRSLLTVSSLRERIAAMRERVEGTASSLLPTRRLTTAVDVVAPLNWQDNAGVDAAAMQVAGERIDAFRGTLPEAAGELTLAQTINATLTDLLAAHPQALVFGEDIGSKGGVYGVTRGLRRAFGAQRVFDTLLDEQTILGTALGASLAGFLPIPEIQYLAYVHNAIDQLRGEAATLSFFSNRQYTNGIVVRVAGLAYQRGFGGHYHNDNSVAALLDTPGMVVAVPSAAEEASGLLRMLAGLALAEGRPCVFLEPIALYHNRDIIPGDGKATAKYHAPSSAHTSELPHRDEGRLHVTNTEPAEILVVTFGNGVGMAFRALNSTGVEAEVYDLRWLAPLPAEHLARIARGYSKVLVVDETRTSGGVSERIITALVDRGYSGAIKRVTSTDSIIPLGPAASTVLLEEDEIALALTEMSTSIVGRAT